MNRSIPTIFIVFMFLASTGCLDALTNSGDSGKFWGEDCEDVSEEICPSGEAPYFSLGLHTRALTALLFLIKPSLAWCLTLTNAAS